MKRPADPNTKPSRVKRRRKRGWKIEKMVDADLTVFRNLDMLFLPINRSVEFSSSKSIGVRAPNQGVFLRPKKIVAPFVRVFVMAACRVQAKAWPAPIPGTANSLHAVARCLAAISGGYQSSVLEPSA